LENMITFAEKYKGRAFSDVPFCVIDSLILSQIVYYDYRDSFFETKIFRKRISEYYRTKEEIILKGMMTASGDEKLIEVLKKGGRHGDLKACSYVDKLNVCGEKQFAAITFSLGRGEYYIAFRGTDCSVVGWKEDFAMSFRDQIPAQREAVMYATEVMRRFPGKFYFGGHSKGGNLAVYAAAFLEEDLQKRLLRVYNFDGPGFLESMHENLGYMAIKTRVFKFVPQTSIIGMLLEETLDYQVIHSNADAIWQHDPYTWEVSDRDFRREDTVDEMAIVVKRTLDSWLAQLPLSEREKIVTTVFDVIYGAGINWFYELTEQRFDKVRALLNNAAEVEQEERKRVFDAVKRLLSIAAEELRRASKEEYMPRLEKAVAQLELRAAQVERFLQSVQRGEWNKTKSQDV